METRPSRESIHMQTAFLWGQRSVCKRPNRKIGCVITTQDMRQILSIGYCGPSRKLPNDSCRNIPKNCGCLHAETNSIAYVDGTIPNKIMFVTMSPCEMCAALITQVNIKTVYFTEYYQDNTGLELLEKCGIKTIKL